MTGNKGKSILINLSDDDDDDIDATSSSSSREDDCTLIDDEDDIPSNEEEDEDDEDGDDDDDDDFDDDDEEEAEESEEEEEEEEEDDYHCEEDEDDEQTLSNQVLRFLREKRDLQELSMKACKSYLRQHGLRVSGNKDVCVQRVLEHWRIKDRAESLYPRTSFNINCKGVRLVFVSLGVVEEQVMSAGETLSSSRKRSMEVTRNGKLLGKRTIAGRVVKESYGAAKQQHTFTVEVLWSKGVKKLPLLFPLLVKGRNLYRLETYRQPWKNESERRKVLAEKHTRGAAARLKREKRKNAWSNGNSGEGSKSQRVAHGPRSRSSKMMSCSSGGTDFGKKPGVSTSKNSITNSSIQPYTRKNTAKKHAAKTKISKPSEKHQNPTLRTQRTASRRNPKLPGDFHHGSMPIRSRMTDFQHNFSHHDSVLRPASQYTGSYNIGYIHPPRLAHENHFQYLPSEIGSGRQQYGLFRCSILGCVGPGSDRCVIAACWRCCRREGLRCNVHN